MGQPGFGTSAAQGQTRRPATLRLCEALLQPNPTLLTATVYFSASSHPTMPCTVASIRAELTPEQNAKYKDYRIERWIAQKKGNQVAVLQAIGSQSINEDRAKAILALPKRRQATVAELDRKVLSIIHIALQHQVVVYVNTRNQAAAFDEQEAGDALLLFMYYLLHQIEELEGEGHAALYVVDMMEAPSPKLGDLEQQLRMFSGIVGRSFPGVFPEILLCCTWGKWARSGVSTLARAAGQNAAFISPAELMARLGRESTPTVVGGDYDLDAGEPISALVMGFADAGNNAQPDQGIQA